MKEHRTNSIYDNTLRALLPQSASDHIGLLSPNPRVLTKKGEIFSPEKKSPQTESGPEIEPFSWLARPILTKIENAKELARQRRILQYASSGSGAKVCRSCGCAGGVRQQVKKCGQQAHLRVRQVACLNRVRTRCTCTPHTPAH